MSPTSKQSKSSDLETWVSPSALSLGDLATFVHVKTGSIVRGKIISTDPGLGCRIREVDDEELTMLRPHKYIQDRYHTVKELNGDEMH